MSADQLRAAASLLRERAEAATPGPWTSEPVDGDVWSSGNRERVCQTSSYAYAQDAAHIAALHPAVALALADWLDLCADTYDLQSLALTKRAVAVARTYLGEQS